MAEQDKTQILVDRAKAGDRAAFDDLIGKTQSRLRDTVQSWTRFRIGPPLNVQDILQETFVRAFRSIRDFEWTHDDAFFRWLCGIAKRALAQAAQDHRKLKEKQATASFDRVANDDPTQSQEGHEGGFMSSLSKALGTSKVLFLAMLFVLGPLANRAEGDVISNWNNIAIQAVKATSMNPLAGSRTLSIMHVAQFNAVNSVQRRYTPYSADFESPGANPEAAAAQAAYGVLASVFPTQTATLDAALAASLATVSEGPPKADGIAIGKAAAAGMLARRADDGSTAVVPYVPGSRPGVWVPTPPAFAPAILPHWRFVTPFVMNSPSQFRPAPPPDLTSDTYTRDFNEIKLLGQANSPVRTPAETETALFHIEFVPFTLGSATREAVATHPLPLVESARLFALVYMAMVDAFVSVWDAKFTYNFWRPVTAIPAAATDGNPNTEADPAWMPLSATPPHPEYPAAHTILAAAGVEVLASVFGDEFTFTISSPTLSGKPRTFARFSDFVTDSSNARVWAGFHYRNSTTVAAQMGKAIGQQALQYLSEVKFRRGDCNGDGAIDISDPVCFLGWLFLGGTEPGCAAAANVDGVGTVNITDPIYLLTYLFLGGRAPDRPFPDCGPVLSATDKELGCVTPPKCQ